MEKVLFILAELNDDDIDWILETGSREEIPAGTVLIYEGKTIDAVYILLEGELSVKTKATGDRELANLLSGEVVGEMSFVDTRPPSATVTAKQDSIVLSLPRKQLATKLIHDVGFASRFYRAMAVFLSHRLRLTVKQLSIQPSSGPVSLPDDELADEARAGVALAKNRLDWLLRRLKDGC